MAVPMGAAPAVPRIKSLFELGTIDMYETLGTGRLEKARNDATAAGMLATAAMIDLQLAATYTCRGDAEQTLAAAARSEDMSRRLGLVSLPMSLALRAVAHGFSGDRAAMETAARAALATGGDHETINMIIPGNVPPSTISARGRPARPSAHWIRRWRRCGRLAAERTPSQAAGPRSIRPITHKARQVCSGWAGRGRRCTVVVACRRSSP
jgi:hypothetical protein